MSPVASKAAVEEFLRTTRFTGYQAVPLPHGLRVPGNAKSEAVDFYLADRVAGKSVLDLGTYYGLYPLEAVRRGAARAVGVEVDPERYEVARRICELHGSTYEIRNARVEEFDSDERFDVVLFLNVLHHVLDPVCAMLQVIRRCREILLVEFCLPWDVNYLRYLGAGEGRSGMGGRRAALRSWLLRLVGRGLPLMAVGNREYHRTFYFSPEAFRNLFVVHHKVLRSVEFLPSPSSRYRSVAVCRVASEGQGAMARAPGRIPA